MLAAIVLATALLCGAQAYEGCEQEFEESTTLQLDSHPIDDLEGSAKPCCLPQQLQGGLYLSSAIKCRRRAGDEDESEDMHFDHIRVDPGFDNPDKRRRNKPTYVKAEGCFAIDYGKGKLRVNERGFTSNKVHFNFSMILDTSAKSVYIINWQKNICVIRPSTAKLQQCISPNATLLAQPTFGLANSAGAGVKVNVYGQRFATKDACGGALSLVTTNKCAPFTAEAEVFTRKRTIYSAISYHDEQTTISNPNVFTPPSFCRKTSEVGYDFIDEELPHLIQHFLREETYYF